MTKRIQNSESIIHNSKTPSIRSEHASTMAELMRSAKTPFVTYRKGDRIQGTITKLTRSEILLDIDAKTEAVVLEKDKNILNKIMNSVSVGDKVTVTVLNPESDLGNPVVSLRGFVENMVWEKLLGLKKKEEAQEVVLDQATKGGFLVTTLDGVSGFLPNSHTSSLDNPQNLIGKKIKVTVLELNRPLHKIIFSQKQVLNISEFRKLTQDFKIGQKIDAIVSNIISFGLYLSIQVRDSKVLEGFIHISEVSWEKVSDLSDNFRLGQKQTAIITGFDQEARRINLSIKRLTSDPLEKKLEEFSYDKKVKGLVSKITDTGVLLDLGDGVEGIIKKEKIPPKVSYKEGIEIQVIVASVDKKRRRVVVVPVLLEKPIGYR